MATKRILIIDDNPDEVATLALLLSDSGHRVEYATNALYAFDLARSFNPQYVLLDIGMPYMDGYEAAAKLKRRFHDAHIFAITGRCGPLERQRSLAAGFEEHLEKPVDVATIERLIAAYGDPS